MRILHTAADPHNLPGIGFALNSRIALLMRRRSEGPAQSTAVDCYATSVEKIGSNSQGCGAESIS